MLQCFNTVIWVVYLNITPAGLVNVVPSSQQSGTSGTVSQRPLLVCISNIQIFRTAQFHC